MTGGDHIFSSDGGGFSASGDGGLGSYEGLEGSRFGSANRGSSASNRVGVRYPSPFFDLATTYMPRSIKQLFRWCAYYAKTNPLISSVVSKRAAYPVTEVIVEDPNTQQKKRWQELLEDQFQIRKTRIEINLDYGAFGNAFVSMSFPFHKYIKCSNCGDRPGGYSERIDRARPHYQWKSIKFYLNCPKCGHYGVARTEDYYYKSIEDTRIVRWSPLYIDLNYNHATGCTDYYYNIPKVLRKDIQIGKRSVIEKVPNVFLDAARAGKSIMFGYNQLFHLKRATLAETDMGWGTPLILPVLKDTFYLQVLRKAQEAIAQDHIVPLRVLFPQLTSEVANPFATVNLSAWRDRIETEVMKWRLDSNYIPILPLPIGHEMIGGQGRALVLHEEIRVQSEHIVAGMDTPNEFIFGGMQFSGSNVSMRMLENEFHGMNSDHRLMVRDFFVDKTADYMGWKRPKNVKFAKFKMADDLQRDAFYFQLNQAQKISDRTLLERMGEDLDTQEELKAAELKKQLDNYRRQQLAQAEVQGQQQVIQMQYQARAAQASMPQTMGAEPPKQLPSSPQAHASAPAGDGGVGQLMGDASYYEENAQGAPETGVAGVAASPMQLESSQGGYNVLYLAKRKANELEKMPEAQKQMEIQRIQATNPNFAGLVLQILSSSKGGQEHPLSPTQRALPEQKPPRRAAGNAIV